MFNPLPANTALGAAPARVAGCYAAFAPLWIWLSDRALVWLGYTDDHGFLAAAGKGTVFVAVTAAVLFWLVRREVGAARRSEGLLRAAVSAYSAEGMTGGGGGGSGRSAAGDTRPPLAA